MPFSESITQAVDDYARLDLGGDLAWHTEQFPFLANDIALQQRVGEEFYTARYLYKILEGLQLSDQWAVSAQARLQVLQYASIYEACLHHMLFSISKDDPRVKELGRYTSFKTYDVPPSKFVAFEHDGRSFVAAYRAQSKTDISKIRFDDKVDTAINLEIIDQSLGEDLKTIYEARNSVHIHAELKKKLQFSLKLGRLAYWRMEPFCRQLSRYATEQGLPI